MAEEKEKVEKSDKAKEEKEPDKKVPYGQLWRYATAYDKKWILKLNWALFKLSPGALGTNVTSWWKQNVYIM